MVIPPLGDMSEKLFSPYSISQPHELVNKAIQKPTEGSLREVMIRQEKELAALQINIKTVEETFGEDTLLLTVAQGYLKKLLANAKIVMWLSQQHPEYLGEFQAITEIASIASAGPNRSAA